MTPILNRNSVDASESEAASQRYRIGYAFAPKKEQSFIQPSLLDHASRSGIDFIPISITDSDSTNSKALTEQGHFHCIIHKLYGHHWNQQLKEYSSKYPQTLILDPPESIERLHNRVSMLDVVNDFKSNSTSTHKARISVPKQVLIQDHHQQNDHNEELVGLEFPVISKPLLANGSAKSHEMCLVFDAKGLQSLLVSTNTSTTPLLLQQFVNHGGVIFKVYVIGENVQCVKRRSLPDISEEQLSTLQGAVLPFSQISNSAQDERRLAHDPHEMPPSDFVEELARGIRVGLKLNFFNFDVIRDSEDPHSYFVIDINYFPGYAKLPSYERVLTDFLLALLLHKNKNQKHQMEQAASSTLDLDHVKQSHDDECQDVTTT